MVMVLMSWLALHVCNLPSRVNSFIWNYFFNFEQSDIWYDLERMHVFVIIKLQEALN